jgi:hypothetical protein
MERRAVNMMILSTIFRFFHSLTSVKKLLRISAKLLFSLFLTFLLIEIGLRLFPGVLPLDLLILFSEQPRLEIAQRLGLATQKATVPLDRDDDGPELRIFKPYTPLIYYIQENGTTVETVRDELGFCNPPGSYRSPTIDLITLGDSFTMCHAVSIEETWASQLAELSGYSVYNLGRAGVGILEYLQLLKKFGLQKSPKLVLMNIYEGNDLRDAERYYRYVRGERDEAEEPPAGPQALLAHYSYAYNLLQSGLEYLQYAARPEPDIFDDAADQGVTLQYKLVFPDGIVVPYNLKDTDEDEVRFARRLRARTVDIGVSQTIIEALRHFVELSKQYNFIPIVAYTPSAHTAYSDKVIFEDPSLSELMPWFSREQRHFLESNSQTLGYTFIDLTPDLQAAARTRGPEELLYYQFDLHLTPLGHAVVAQILNRKLRDIGLNPAK